MSTRNKQKKKLTESRDGRILYSMGKTMTTPGNALNNEIHFFLLKCPAVSLVWRQNSGRFKARGHLYKMGYDGQGDICGMMVGGRHFQFEGKIDDEPSRAQLDNIDHINRTGGIAQVVRSLDEVKERLRREGYEV